MQKSGSIMSLNDRRAMKEHIHQMNIGWSVILTRPKAREVLFYVFQTFGRIIPCYATRHIEYAVTTLYDFPKINHKILQ